MAAIYTNFLNGTLSADPGSGGTTLSSAALANMPQVTAPDFMWLVIDPAGAVGAPEVVKVTAHTAAATTATIVRGQQGSVARAWPVGTSWDHSPTAFDLAGGGNIGQVSAMDLAGSGVPKWVNGYISGPIGSRPAAAASLEGVVYGDTTNKRLWVCDGTTWVFFRNYTAAARPGVILQRVAALSIPNAAATDLVWDTATANVDNWITVSSATLTVPATWDGRWLVSLFLNWAASPGTQTAIVLIKNGTGFAEGPGGGQAFFRPSVSAIETFAAGDTIRAQVFQNSGAALNISSAKLHVEWLGR